jgi:molybdopterin-guanine dinucleotide biosynthesis protein A
MGGRPKGLLPAPDTAQPLVARLAELARAAGLEAVLVGEASAYQSALPGLEVLADQPAGVGPLGGLGALLTRAGDRPALVLACDLPYLTRPVLERLASQPSTAAVLAPRASPEAPWEALLARYDPAQVRGPLEAGLAAGVRSFQVLFSRLTIELFVLNPDEHVALSDWDSPADLPR